MKTKNNVQKAVTKSLAVIISLVLISITVNAQDFWKRVLKNNSFRQIAMVMTESTEAGSASTDATSSNNTDAFSELFAEESEEALDLEHWMTNENHFFTSVAIETEIENDLEIESWMTNESLFNGNAAYFEVETEESLKVEGWMQNQDYFGVKTVQIETETEAAMEIEKWMTDNKTWNK